MTSKCKQCGEALMQTGNYTFKILPAKRIPKKGRKQSRTGCLERGSLTNFPPDTTSFQKFLLKRTRPSNHIQLTCGKCGATSKIKMWKNSCSTGKDKRIETPSLEEPGATNIISAPKKKKRTKDKTAGLNLPSKSNVQEQNSSSSSPLQRTCQQLPAAVAESKKKAGGKKSLPSFQKMKDMDKLKKILFDSKKAKKSGSSLQDFLSSI